jgi:hypothetical protein
VAALYGSNRVARGRADDARRELSECQRLNGMKEHLKEMYREMRLQPGKPDSQVPDLPK